MADLFPSISTLIASSYPSKFLPDQYHMINSFETNKATSNDIDIDLTTSTVLLWKSSTLPPLFSINEPTLGTGGAPEIERAKKIKKNQNNRVYIDQLVDPNIICSEEDVTKYYNLSMGPDKEQYINNVPTKIRNKNLGTIHGQYDNKLRNVKYKNKKEYVHRKKKLPITYAKLPVLDTITTKLSRRERKTTTIHQQKQDSTRTHQPVLETTEKTMFRTKSINILQTNTSKPLEH